MGAKGVQMDVVPLGTPVRRFEDPSFLVNSENSENSEARSAARKLYRLPQMQHHRSGDGLNSLGLLGLLGLVAGFRLRLFDDLTLQGMRE